MKKIETIDMERLALAIGVWGAMEQKISLSP